MSNPEVTQVFAKSREHAGQPGHKGLAVVAHELKRLAAKFKAFVKPAQHPGGCGPGQDCQPDHEPRVVVHQAEDPGPDVFATAQVDEERAFDVDVPEFVGLASLVAWARSARHGSTATTERLEELVDVARADSEYLSAPHLGRDSL